MINIFERQLLIYEAKAKLATTIASMTKKGKRYVKYSELKSKMGLDDAGFDEVIGSAQRANRHSNKYIFTSIDDEPAVGITALKRKAKKKKGMTDVDPTDRLDVVDDRPESPESDSGKGKKDAVDYNASHHDYRGIPVQSWPMMPKAQSANESIKSSRAYHHREDELWRITHREGWRGLDKRNLLPEGWNKMSDKEIVDTILEAEFLNEAKAAFATKSGTSYAVNISGLSSNAFFDQPFGRQLDDRKTIEKWKEGAKKAWVDAKGKSTMAAVKKWVKDNKPKEFYAQWKADSSSYSDDSVEIWYK